MELASSSEDPRIQGVRNRHAPSNTVTHLRHPGVNTFMPNLPERVSSRYGRARDPPGPRLEQELRFALELPDPLPRQLKLRGELGERRGIPVVEAVAPHQDVAGLLRQTPDCLPEPRPHLFYDGVRDVAERLVDDEVLEARRLDLARDRLAEAGGVRDGSPHVSHLLDGPAQP